MAPMPESELDLKRFFAEIKTIAVVGYSDKPDRAGYYVAHYLADAGYTVLAINPKPGLDTQGLPRYASLADIPAATVVDVVDVFRAPAFVPEVFHAAAKLMPKPKYFWMQPGAESAEAAELARGYGITPVEGCMMAAHKIWV